MGSGPDEEQSFRLQFLEARGVAFQNLFSDIMDRAFPGDFQRVRPHGNTGDLKCDGYLRSRRTVFQVYGPDEIRRLQPLLRKIAEDFRGACIHWADRMDEWVFVHNSLGGLPAQAIHLLGDLAGRTGAPKIEVWGYERLRAIASQGVQSAQRPSLDAMRLYWQWLSAANRPEQTPHHLLLLSRLRLPIRLAEANVVRDWDRFPPGDVQKQVRTGKMWEIAEANDRILSHGEAHARFYSMVRKHRHLLITGDSGSGKSTQARKLLQAGTGKRGRHTPVLVELWRFSLNRPVIDLIYDSVNRAAAGIARDELVVALELGYILLLLDGMDEVSQEYRRECLAQIYELTDCFPRAPVVLTSRYFPTPPAGFHELAIAPFTVKDIEAALAMVDQDRTIQKNILHTMPDFLVLCSRPLTLGFVLYALEQGDSVPRNLYALYDQVFSGLFEWEVRRGRLASVAAISSFLEEGAHHMSVHGAPVLSVSEWIASASGGPRGKALNWIISNERAENAFRVGISVGLLNSDGGNVSFTHRSFQEFYAARRILREEELLLNTPIDTILPLARFLFGSIRNSEALLERVFGHVNDIVKLTLILRATKESGCQMVHFDMSPVLERVLTNTTDISEFTDALYIASELECEIGRFEALHWAIETARELGIEITHGLRAVAEDLEQMSWTVDELVKVALDFRPKAASILLDAAYGIADGVRFDESKQWLEQVIGGLEQYEREETRLLRRFLAIWTFDSPAGADDFERDARFEEWSEHYSEFLATLAKQDFSGAESRLSEMIELMTPEPVIIQAHRCPETLDLFNGVLDSFPEAD